MSKVLSHQQKKDCLENCVGTDEQRDLGSKKNTILEKQPHTHLPTPPLCGAKASRGTTCEEPRVRNPDGSYRPRCYKHGCAPGSGAPKGNQNALKNGLYGAEMKARRLDLREARKLLKKLNAKMKEINRLANDE